MPRILRNSVKCKHCGEEVVSKHRHDFVGHACKVKPTKDGSSNFFVDGGREYLRRVGGENGFNDMIETSEYYSEKGHGI